MKKIAILLLAAALTGTLQAQIKIPPASTPATLKAGVGLTTFEISYSRPDKRGRVIYGDLVPFGKIWRTGANMNTTIEFSDDVEVGDKTLKAGKYALYTIPNENEWQIYFYEDATHWGFPIKLEDAKIAAIVPGKVQNLPFSVETFTISVDNVQLDSAELGILWDDTYVSTKIKVPTDQKVMASIEKVMAGENPTMQEYLAASNYYYAAGKDMQQAMKWADAGMKMNEKPQYYQLRQQALIHYAAGDKTGAIELAKKALAAAKEVGSDDHIKLNEDSLREWTNQ